ncbi:MAG: DUF6883 domain-containing protein [Thermosynechococcaceae cyanobacterium]
MKLPNAQEAYIDDDKLVSYCLNPQHSDGQYKARVFWPALDLDIENVGVLKIALLEAVQGYEAQPIRQNAYGQKHVIDFPMTHNGRTATIHSVWIVRDNETFPRLVTCYVL